MRDLRDYRATHIVHLHTENNRELAWARSTQRTWAWAWVRVKGEIIQYTWKEVCLLPRRERR